MADVLKDETVHELMNWAVFPDKDGWTVCRCGAHWSLKIGSTYDDVLSFFSSHVRYFQNETVIL